MKKIIAIAVAALLLAGCSNNTANESTSSATSAEISSETTSSAAENSSESVSSSVSTSVEENSSTKESSSAPVESSSSASSLSTTEKPVSSSSSSSSSSSTKPVENPVSSSSTNKPTSSSSKPVSSSSKPACEHIFFTETVKRPHPECLMEITKCRICGYELSRKPTHEYENGVCIWCGKYDPNVSHNCTRDGHIWNKSYTESSTENVEIVETHTLCENGYDIDLAVKFFGLEAQNVDFTPYFGTNAFGAGSSKVKTTGVKTITRFIHWCSECGYKEIYNTEETVTPGETWVFVNGSRSKNDYCSVIWYDINNIPDEVYEGVEKLLKDREEWKNSLRNNR